MTCWWFVVLFDKIVVRMQRKPWGFGGKHVCLGYLHIFAQFSRMWMLHRLYMPSCSKCIVCWWPQILKRDDPKGLLAARQAAKRQVERELIAQIQSYAKESDCVATDDYDWCVCFWDSGQFHGIRFKQESCAKPNNNKPNPKSPSLYYKLSPNGRFMA